MLTKETKDIVTIVTIILLSIVLLGIGPVITIWSINTLFLTQIALNFWTWLAMVYLQMVTFGGIISNLVVIKNKL